MHEFDVQFPTIKCSLYDEKNQHFHSKCSAECYPHSDPYTQSVSVDMYKYVYTAEPWRTRYDSVCQNRKSTTFAQLEELTTHIRNIPNWLNALEGIIHFRENATNALAHAQPHTIHPCAIPYRIRSIQRSPIPDSGHSKLTLIPHDNRKSFVLNGERMQHCECWTIGVLTTDSIRNYPEQVCLMTVSGAAYSNVVFTEYWKWYSITSVRWREFTTKT